MFSGSSSKCKGRICVYFSVCVCVCVFVFEGLLEFSREAKKIHLHVWGHPIPRHAHAGLFNKGLDDFAIVKVTPIPMRSVSWILVQSKGHFRFTQWWMYGLGLTGRGE